MQNVRLAGYMTHLLTATGAALGFLALMAVISGDLVKAFAWLGVALVVDAIDGPLARKVAVKENAPRYDGAVLDLVVDFVTYVFVPAAMLIWGGLVPGVLGLIAALAIVAGSALYFADTRMKTEDWWFLGFPAVWNIVMLYLAVFPLPGWISFALVMIAVAMMFLPFPFVHPIRVRRWRALTIAMLCIWCVSAVLAIVYAFRPGALIEGALVVTAIYFLGLGFLRQIETTRSQSRS
ncbi:CDP-alcohol phosphatidyltransferase family protein [Terrarubrum flagellatum]|uniref:CDP-alcohol phosphatidyltransferase family protein n=1 Tax=Terrirubrum flagellatum TaxID=2895980 RepID=UPI0031456467